ncbi:Kynurenine--oxoglutarate transaminase 3 [Toxocara canis]|uniref:Kynurenine--oxoglutarate transaminase 3 n=1 Tax=Toxocara canis TaxID=6265 RepID=A0A0B2UWK7_TOXCA|nr:Kynurenine--oxoglutarate transaminase 3 [Toxocara canis]
MHIDGLCPTLLRMFATRLPVRAVSLGRSSIRGVMMSTSGTPHRQAADRIADTKPSIWVEFTTLAAECNAVNIGQGFPDSPMPQFVADILKEVASHPERTDWHQYTRGFGHPRLVSALANLYSKLLNVEVNAQNDVLVTVGAYLALYYTFNGWINPGDEVIVLQPAYDCYVPQVEIAGGTAVPIPLELASSAKSSADYRVNLAAIEAKITDRTKFIVINNPHNPTGKLFSREELEGIADIVKRHNLLVIADEVYEWHVYQGREMIRFASIPGMYERTITIGSAGKIFSVTGWKLGWAIGPAALLAPLKAVHQNCVFTCSTPTQEAVAQAIERELSVMWSQPMASYFKTELVSELQTKRDRMAAMLRAAGMKPIIPDSGYFMMADFSSLIRRDEFQSYGDSSDPLDFRFVRWMCREKNLAMIPPSAFYSDEYKKDNDHMVRVCFFKTDRVMDKAELILRKLSLENVEKSEMSEIG